MMCPTSSRFPNDANWFVYFPPCAWSGRSAKPSISESS